MKTTLVILSKPFVILSEAKYLTRSLCPHRPLNFLVFLFLITLTGCKLELPAVKVLKSCTMPTTIAASPDANELKKYTFTLDGSMADIRSISWYNNNTGALLGSELSAILISGKFIYTFPADGTYSIRATINNICGDGSTTLTVSVIVNTAPSVASSFAITDPMVHSNLSGVAVANDGTIIANDNNEIKIWNPFSRTLIRTLKGHTSNVVRMVLSADEKYLYASDQTNIIVWDWRAGTIQRTITSAHGGSYIHNIKLTANGKYLASVGNDRNIRIWDTDTGANIKAISFTENSVYFNGLSINHINGYVSGFFQNGGLSYFVIWDYQTGSEVWRQTISDLNYFSGLSFSSDGSKLFFGYYNSRLNGARLQVWTPASKQLERELVNSSGSGSSDEIKPSADGKTLLVGSSLWNTQNYSFIRTITIKIGFINFSFGSQAFSANGLYVGGGVFLGTIDVQQVANGISILTPPPADKHSILVSSAEFTNDGRLITTDVFSGVKIWNSNTGQSTTSFSPGKYMYKLSPTTDNKYILSKNCGTTSIFNLSNGSLYKEYTSSCNGNTNALVASDGTFFVNTTGNNEISLAIRDFNTGNILRTLNGHTDYIRSIALTPDNKNIVSAGSADNTVKIWEVSTGNQIRSITTPDFVSLISISPDVQSIISTGFNQAAGRIYAWNYNTGQAINNWVAHSGTINTFAYSSDGKFLVSGGQLDNKVKIWNMPAGTLYKEITLGSSIIKVGFNAANSQVYAVTQKDFQVLNLK